MWSPFGFPPETSKTGVTPEEGKKEEGRRKEGGKEGACSVMHALPADALVCFTSLGGASGYGGHTGGAFDMMPEAGGVEGWGALVVPSHQQGAKEVPGGL